MNTTATVVLGMSLFVVVCSEHYCDAAGHWSSVPGLRNRVLAQSRQLLAVFPSDTVPSAIDGEIRDIIHELEAPTPHDIYCEWLLCQRLRQSLAGISLPPATATQATTMVQPAVWEVSIGRGFLRESTMLQAGATARSSPVPWNRVGALKMELQATVQNWEAALLDQMADELCVRLAKP